MDLTRRSSDRGHKAAAEKERRKLQILRQLKKKQQTSGAKVRFSRQDRLGITVNYADMISCTHISITSIISMFFV